MFINAEPRYVSNGYDFEAFVPNPRAEALYRYRKFLEMSNNDINAWSVYRSTDPSANDTWNGYLDCYESDENYPTVHSLYGDCFQNPASTVSQHQAPYAQGQVQTGKITSSHNNSANNMECYEQLSPMLGHDYAQMSLDRRQGSFAEFSSARNVLQDFKYHPATESAPNSLTSTISSSFSASSFADDGSSYGQSGDINRISPEALSCYSPTTQPAPSQFSASFTSQVSPEVFDCYSPPPNPASTQFSASSSAHHVQRTEAGARGKLSSGDTRSVRGPSQTPYDFNMSFEGLPKYPNTQQPVQRENNWTTQSTEQHKTISPKVLRLNASSTSLTSADAGQESMAKITTNLATAQTDMGTSTTLLAGPEQSGSRVRQVLPSAPRLRSSSQLIIPVMADTPPVKILPSTAPRSKTSSHRSRPRLLPNDEYTPSRSSRKRSIKAIEPESHSRRSSPPSQLAPNTSSRVQRAAVTSTAPTSQKTMIKLKMPSKSSTESNTEDSAVVKTAEHHRNSGNDFLVRARMDGMSYKDIQEQGRYTEAISTLRGRYRTLTKNKASRVRKPEWSDKDLALLKKAVNKLAIGDPAKGKIPWAKVADYIADNGGSYHFGNSTCHKRWDMLMESMEHGAMADHHYRR